MSLETATALREWFLVLPVLALLFVPGLGPAWVFSRKSGLSLPWALSLAFSWSVAWCSLLAMGAFLLHLQLDVVIWGFALAVPVSLALIWRDVRANGVPSTMDRGLPGLATAAVAWVVAAVQGPWWFGTSDNFFHIAASRSLIATGRPIVTDPFFGLESRIPDSTAGMWNTVQAVIARLVFMDIAFVYRALTAASAFAVALAFWVLLREISGRDFPATIATVAYFVAAWYTDLRAFAYPNKVSIALAFITIALTLRVVSDPRAKWVVATAAAGLSTLAVHLASGQIQLLCMAGICVSVGALSLVRKDAEERRGARRAVLLVIASIGLMILPALPTLFARVMALKGSLVLGEDSFIWAADQIKSGPFGMRFVEPGGFDFGGPLLFWLTLALAVFAIVYAVRTGSRRAAAAVPLMCTAHVITLFPLVSTPWLLASSYMLARMVELFRFSPFLAIAFALGTLELDSMRRLARVLGWVLLAAALVVSLPYTLSTYVQGEGTVRRGAIWSVAEARERDMRKAYGYAEIAQMRRLLGNSYPTVASDPDSAYHLMGLVPVAVVPSLPTHTPVFIDRGDVAARTSDMNEFFEAGTSRARRAEILDHYDADYVFFRRYISGYQTRDELLADPEMYEVLVRNDDIMLMRVDKELARERAKDLGSASENAPAQPEAP
ncbi:MAG: hypothetical protein KJ747_05780 [Actinobacteria bacterium]|nr:hypothetical protein [Actinomycetota bacterium]MCG2807159.1 hypothetical protein [Coriobacteriia bacterium]